MVSRARLKDHFEVTKKEINDVRNIPGECATFSVGGRKA